MWVGSKISTHKGSLEIDFKKFDNFITFISCNSKYRYAWNHDIMNWKNKCVFE